MPTLWQKSLPDPIGTAANSGRRSAGTLISPLTISCTVPPPPHPPPAAYPSGAARRGVPVRRPVAPQRRHDVVPVEGGLAGDLGGVARVFGGSPVELALPGDDPF